MFPSFRRPVCALGALTLLTSVQSCGQGTAWGAEGQAGEALETTSAPADEWIELMRDKHLSLRYRGTRRVLLIDPPSGRKLEYLEHVGCDGLGRFSIDTQWVDGEVESREEFEISQLGRQGYVFRHRDFAVRDPEAFSRNYSVEPIGRESVGDRLCQVLSVERRDGTGSHHEVHLDLTTGLLLRTEQRDRGGRLLSRVGYESIELDADLEDLRLEDHRLHRRLLDVDGDPLAWQQELGFEPRNPHPPLGYRLVEAASLATPGGREWLKLSYTDGLESLVFLQAPLLPGQKATWDVGVAQVGGSTLIQGVLGEVSVLVLGRADRDILLGWLDTTFSL